jgi:hypothetical protein
MKRISIVSSLWLLALSFAALLKRKSRERFAGRFLTAYVHSRFIP